MPMRWIGPPTDRLDLPWTADDPCPCGAGRLFGACCLTPSGRPYPRLASTRPPGAVTGYAHPRCYMRSTDDCSTVISREHYISRGLISRPGLKIRGLPWQTELVQHSSADALTSKILCQRHNNALSPLDQQAQRAFLTIEAARIHATKASLSRKRYSAILSGEALELWALKTLAGLHATGMDFAAGPLRFRDFPLPLAKIAQALNTGRPAGLIRLEVPATAEAHEPSIGRSAVTTLMVVDEEARHMTAFLIRLQGLGLMFHLADDDGAFDGGEDARPHMVDLIGPHRSSRIYLGWPEAAIGRIVTLRIRSPSPRDRAGHASIAEKPD